MSNCPFSADCMEDSRRLRRAEKEALALERSVGRLEEALRAIAENAEAWHGPPPDMGHVRSLGVIARRARAALAGVETGQPQAEAGDAGPPRPGGGEA